MDLALLFSAGKQIDLTKELNYFECLYQYPLSFLTLKCTATYKASDNGICAQF